MSDEQIPSEPPSLDKSDPTNAKLAGMIAEQSGKITQGLARLEKLISDPGPPVSEIANRIDDALREDAESEEPKFPDFVRFFLSQLVLDIRCPPSTPKAIVVLALARVFATMIPDDEQLAEIPEGWAPVALAINPMTGEFLTIAGPRSEPDGRVEAVETMFARQMQNVTAKAVGAVREAGRPQPKPMKEGRPIAKPRDEARPQPKPGEPDYEENESEE